ncbi:MAG: hypothetical protein ACRC8C_02770 [Mycoplasmoidaceae bacterium]
MKKEKNYSNYKKRIKKTTLASLSIFAFTSIVLFSSINASLKIEDGLDNGTSLNNNFIKPINDLPKSNIESSQSSRNVITPTTIEVNSGPAFDNIIANNYPFELDRSKVLSLIKFGGTLPNDFNLNTDLDILFSGNNKASISSNPTNSGTVNIDVSISYYIGSNGTTIWTPDKDPNKILKQKLTINRLKSVPGPTFYDKVDSFIPENFYASDVESKIIDINNIFKLNNAVTNSSTNKNTKITELSNTFDNLSGTLRIEYTLENYFDEIGDYISPPSSRSIELSGFKKITGATSLVLKSDMNSLLPSTIANELKNDFKSYSNYFNLVNSPYPNTEITEINNIISNDNDGTLDFTYVINGKYFNDKLVEITSSSIGDSLDTTVSGLNIEILPENINSPNNMIPIIVGSSVGGVVLVAIILAAIFFLQRSKKNSGGGNRNFGTQKNPVQIKTSPIKSNNDFSSNKSSFNSIPPSVGPRSSIRPSNSSTRIPPPKLKNN